MRCWIRISVKNRNFLKLIFKQAILKIFFSNMLLEKDSWYDFLRSFFNQMYFSYLVILVNRHFSLIILDLYCIYLYDFHFYNIQWNMLVTILVTYYTFFTSFLFISGVLIFKFWNILRKNVNIKFFFIYLPLFNFRLFVRKTLVQLFIKLMLI